MSRHIEFRHHANAALARIRDDAADFILRVVEAIRTHALQLGKFLAFDAEALVFREMPVKHVQLHRRHAVQVALQNVERDKVAANINHQSPPGKARAVFDRKLRARQSQRSSSAPIAGKSAVPRMTPSVVGAFSRAPELLMSRRYDSSSPNSCTALVPPAA